jgi:hypothetical protein
MKGLAGTTWTSKPSHIDDEYWRWMYAGMAMQSVLQACPKMPNEDITRQARELAEELVKEMKGEPVVYKMTPIV